MMAAADLRTVALEDHSASSKPTKGGDELGDFVWILVNAAKQ